MLTILDSFRFRGEHRFIFTMDIKSLYTTRDSAPLNISSTNGRSYNLFQNGHYFSGLLFAFKLALVASFLNSKYIYVICRPGGPYWEKLCPRSFALIALVIGIHNCLTLSKKFTFYIVYNTFTLLQKAWNVSSVGNFGAVRNSGSGWENMDRWSARN